MITGRRNIKICCRVCGEHKTLSEYRPSSIKKRDRVCRQCAQNRLLEYKTSEKGKAARRKYQQTKGYRKLANNRYRIKKENWEKWLKDNGYNKCSRCGYDKCFDAIEFHHEEEKFFTVAQFTVRRVCSPKNQRLLGPELKKCIVLCANCHREEHYKMRITDVK